MLTSPKYFLAAAACYTVFATAALLGPRLRPLAWVGLAAGLAANAVAVVARLQQAWPMLPMYLGAQALPLALALVLVASRPARRPPLVPAGAAIWIAACLAALFPKDYYLPFIKSASLPAHLFFVTATFGKACFLASAAWAAATLAPGKTRYRQNAQVIWWAVVGFGCWSLAMFSGELWSYRGWGVPVVWEDPAIVTFMATWFFYVCLLHLHLTGTWSLRLRTIFAAAGGPLVLLLNFPARSRSFEVAVVKAKQLFRLIWKIAGSIHLTVALCLALSADLAAGYFRLQANGHIFATLGEVGLRQWFSTYGRHNLQATAWFYLLLVLLAALVANTFACTTDRVIRLVRTGLSRHLAFRLAPHAMHYAIILMLAGYLVSYLASYVVTSCVLVPGRPTAVAGTGLKIELTAWQPEYYRGSRLPAYSGRVIRPQAVLSLTCGRRSGTAVLKATSPVRFAGYGIFLKNFGPKQKGGMSSRVFLEVAVRRDPGLPFYFAGMALFVLGLAFYLYDRLPAKKQMERQYANRPEDI